MFGGKSLDSVIWRVTKYCIVLYCIDKSHGEMNTVSPRDSHHVCWMPQSSGGLCGRKIERNLWKFAALFVVEMFSHDHQVGIV